MPDFLIRTSLLPTTPKESRDAEATRKFLSSGLRSSNTSNKDQCIFADISETCRRVREMCQDRTEIHGIHSSTVMNSSGSRHTNNGDATRCLANGHEVSKETSNMIPVTIHSQQSSTCSSFQPTLSSTKTTTDSTAGLIQTTSTSEAGEQLLRRPRADPSAATSQPNTLVEIDILRQVRKRTFSHWQHRSSPSTSQMIEAGFFGCNVGDRVICIYCNIICQQWTPNSDDPCEVHKTLSPKCSYVIAMLTRALTSSISIINEGSTLIDPYRSHTIVHTAACNSNYIEIPKRYASFATWANENSPSVDDLVRAGFFYTGTKTIVTCFYCNGSLQNWGSNDNPMTEHARWFPNCAYAKQLCGTELYRKIQESKRAQQERARSNDSGSRSEVGPGNLSDGRLLIPDESTLSRFVAARLDLPISQSLLDRKFKLSIIKRCWEDQLRLKHDDFVSDCDLFMACTILQKQIEGIDGKKENIIVPSVAMKRVREKEQAGNLSRNRINVDVCTNNIVEARAREQAGSGLSSTNSSEDSNMETTASSESDTNEMGGSAPTSAGGETKQSKLSSLQNVARSHENNPSPANPCVLCLEEEKRLACMPCGHLATCVPCGHSLRTCPICRRGIDAFVRIYL